MPFCFVIIIHFPICSNYHFSLLIINIVATVKLFFLNLSASRAQILIARNLSAPMARDTIVALRARSYILYIHLSLFLVIWYWNWSQFYNIVDVNYIFLKLLNLFLILNEKGNSIYLRLYRPQGTHSHHDIRALCSIFCIHICNFLIL